MVPKLDDPNFIRAELDKDSVLVEGFDIEKGGIYLEMTYDPRGFFLGDKTRIVYKSSIEQILLLTNLKVSVSSHWDGIKVYVHNPKEIGRMLTSKNDSVGSSVEYAKYDGSSPVELRAQPGQHICIESITNGSFIRVQIFPGENIKDYFDKRIDLIDGSLENIRYKCISAIENIDKLIHLEADIDKSFEIFIENAKASEIGGLKRPNFFPFIQELNLQKEILLTIKFHLDCQIEDNLKKIKK